MPGLRILIIVVAAFIAAAIIRRLLRQRPKKPRPPAVTSTVRCAQCGVVLPEQDALSAEGRHFCCAEHRDRFGEDSRDG